MIDAASGRAIDTVQGEQGFLRGSLRALARERQRNGLGPQAPFELTGHVDGRITLQKEDGTRVEVALADILPPPGKSATGQQAGQKADQPDGNPADQPAEEPTEQGSEP